MFYYIKLYLRDWRIYTPLLISSLIQIFIWVYLIWSVSPSQERVFLHYNIVFGVDLVGNWWQLLLLPAAGTAVLLLNTAFSYFIYKVDKFLSRLLVFWIIFFHIFLLMAIIALVRINA